jgi:hypothetical protein
VLVAHAGLHPARLFPVVDKIRKLGDLLGLAVIYTVMAEIYGLYSCRNGAVRYVGETTYPRELCWQPTRPDPA